VLGRIAELYVVLETSDGMVVMDPHAAHERVLFEKYMREVANGKAQSQGLLLPQTLELTPRDSARLRKELKLLRGMGFGISEFGEQTFVVDAVPAALPQVPVEPVIIEIMATLAQAGPRGARGRWREEAVAQAACKAAVKARDALTLPEIERLVEDLARAEMPYTCPHGRPTLILTTLRELGRKFGREG
jgi:DNA mismatch repair protein MutL